jgi:hypothetical protein
VGESFDSANVNRQKGTSNGFVVAEKLLRSKVCDEANINGKTPIKRL